MTEGMAKLASIFCCRSSWNCSVEVESLNAKIVLLFCSFSACSKNILNKFTQKLHRIFYWYWLVMSNSNFFRSSIIGNPTLDRQHVNAYFTTSFGAFFPFATQFPSSACALFFFQIFPPKVCDFLSVVVGVEKNKRTRIFGIHTYPLPRWGFEKEICRECLGVGL